MLKVGRKVFFKVVAFAKGKHAVLITGVVSLVLARAAVRLVKVLKV